MKKRILFFSSMLILLSICFAFSNHDIVQKNNIKDLEDAVINMSESNSMKTQENVFDDTIDEIDITNLSKGYIYIVFDSFNCTKEEVLDLISSLDKKKYLGVINDVHFIQMRTTNYEELYSICKNISQNNIVGCAYVFQDMFDDTLTNDEVESYKGEEVIYIQYIPSGQEANVDVFLEYSSKIKDAKYLGRYQNSVFLQFENKSQDELESIRNSFSYPNGYINAYILE